ncbi:hypothetical protein FNV43_RR26951 [Rhamnella rubrinervis]|uniref:Uncharacterized protein n=1 Tax=Rhamnella rubrinervis TaxID=2594499 RepID=A0A8K0DJH1_9ROSA|nr:hypothetical protein FNV43_RR26951 [Rhamnella rubrinervis]
MFLSLIAILIALLQLKNLGKSASLFDTHPITMVAFCVIFLIYAILVLADELVQQPNENDYGGILSKAILCSGSLGVVILSLMIFPLLGWSLLVLWGCLIAKDFFQELFIILPLTLRYKALQAFHTFRWGMARPRTLTTQQNRAPV